MCFIISEKYSRGHRAPGRLNKPPEATQVMLGVSWDHDPIAAAAAALLPRGPQLPAICTDARGNCTYTSAQLFQAC